MTNPSATQSLAPVSLSVTTPSGIPVQISIREYTEGDPVLHVHLPTFGLKGVCGQPLKLVSPRQGATHYLPLSKPVGLDSGAAAQIDAALADWRAAWTETPAGRERALRAERLALVDHVNSIGDEIMALRERAFSLDTGEGWDRITAAERRFEAARQSLCEYDEAHPDLTAKLQAEKDERLARFLATD